MSESTRSVGCKQCGSLLHKQADCAFYQASLQYSKDKRSHGYEYSHYDIPMYDTHCHLDIVYERFRHKGVDFKEFRKNEYFPTNFAGCISSFSDPASFSGLGIWKELIEQDGIWGTFGVHPHHAKDYSAAMESRFLDCLAHPKALAVGECGLDYFRSQTKVDKQKEVFLKHIQLARVLEKPLVIHSREAEDDVYEILVERNMHDWPIHVHCFTGDRDQMLQFVNEFPNMCFGFTNLASYDSAKTTREVLKTIPLDRILLETDSPYFVPKSLKKMERFSHPGNVLFVAEEIADIKGKDVDVVLDNCRRNTMKIFKI